MKRNPVNIINDTIDQAREAVTLAIRANIHASRAKKFEAIDLRKYRNDPKKKERIKEIETANNLKAFFLYNQIRVVMMHPIRTQTFQPGGLQIEKGKEFIL